MTVREDDLSATVAVAADTGATPEELPADKYKALPADAFSAFMCKTDFLHDARGAMGGTRIFPSEDDARRERGCIQECGLVEVTISLARTVQEEDFSAFRANAGEPS